jgi:hypothetical protein
MTIKSLVAAALFSLATTTTSMAGTIDFESVPSGSCAFLGSSVSTQGFTFEDTSGGGLFSCNAGVIHTGSSSALIAANVTSSLTFFDDTLASFSLAGFEAGTRTNSVSSEGVIVTGTKTDLTTVDQTFIFNGSSFDQFSLSSVFIDLVSVNILAFGGSSNPQFLIDNIEVNVSAVPIPAGGLLLLTGFAGLAGLRRSKRRVS